MNSSYFKKLVSKHFAPEVRQLGWKGSGFHFYKQNPNHVVNIFGIQGVWFGGSVCCETAIHFDFLSDLSVKKGGISKITFASCIIRDRLRPMDGASFDWSFEESEEANIQSVKEILTAFKKFGSLFYEDFANFPQPFDSIKPQDLVNNIHYKLLDKYHLHNSIFFIWLLKEINQFIGRQNVAKEFSAMGMEQTMQHVEKWRGDLKKRRSDKEIEEFIARNKELLKI